MFHRRTVQVPPYVVERGHHGLEEVGLKTKGAGRPVSHGRTRHAYLYMVVAWRQEALFVITTSVRGKAAWHPHST